MWLLEAVRLSNGVTQGTGIPEPVMHTYRNLVSEFLESKERIQIAEVFSASSKITDELKPNGENPTGRTEQDTKD